MQRSYEFLHLHRRKRGILLSAHVPFRGGLVAVWLVLLFLLCGGVSIPVRAELQFDVFVGFGTGVADGIVPESSWFPLVIEVYNDGPSFNGVIEVSNGAVNQGQDRVLAMELPNGTRKREILPVYAANRYSSSWDARLRDSHGKVRAERLNLKPRRQVVRESVLFAALTRTAGGTPTLPEIKANRAELQPVALRVLPELFPDNPIVLEGVNAIFLHSEKALELKVGQVNALLAWLHAGGHLIVGIEQLTHVTGNPWLRGLLPCDITGVTTKRPRGVMQDWVRREPNTTKWEGATIPSRGRQPSAGEARRYGLGTPPRGVQPPTFNPSRGPLPPETNPFAQILEDETFENGDMQVATVTLRDGKVVIGSDEAPLVIDSTRGRGRLTVLTFSPELEPFRSWRNRPWFWARLVNLAPEWFTTSDGWQQGTYHIDGVFGAMIDSRQIRKMPVAWLLLLLIAYLLVIGPFDQYFLKRINRQMLTWVTFPAYVAIFSALIYLIGFYLRAGETEWNELHVVDVVPVGEQADLRGRTYASIYSPANAKYALQSPDPPGFATLRGEQGAYGAQETTKAVIEQKGGSFRAEISVPVWVNQLYVSDWWRQNPAPLQATVTERGNQWDVKVENRMDRKITDAKLVAQGRVLDLGEVGAKQSKTFSVDRSSGTLMKDFVSGQANSFQQAAQNRNTPFGREQAGRLDDAATATMAASFISLMGSWQNQYAAFRVTPGLDLAPLAERGDAIVLAWAPDYSPVPSLNRFSPRRTHRNTLLRVAVPLSER